MKKSICLVLALAMLFLFAGPVLAATNNAEFVIGLNQYFVNNQMPGITMDAAPYIDSSSGRTLVPVRYLGDALGATTNWDEGNQRVSVISGTGTTTLEMEIGNTTLWVNNQGKTQDQTLDQAPVIESGRTYLPARWVAGALGYSVDWNAANKIVIIYKGQEPDVSNLASQKPTVVNRFNIPAGTELTVSTNTPANVPIDFHIDTSKGDVQSQVADAQNVLSQAKFLDPATVTDALTMINYDVSHQMPEATGTFNSPNGGCILVSGFPMGNGSNAYVWIDIEVWNQHLGS